MKQLVAISIGALLVATLASRSDAAAFALQGAAPSGWTAQGDVNKVIGQKLYDLIDGFADIHMGFAFQESEHLTLSKGKARVEVSVFRTDTPANAFGLYSCLRDRTGELLAIGDGASIAYGTAVAWRGPYVVEVKDTSEAPAPAEEIVALTRALVARIEAHGEPPDLVRAFPREGLVEKGLVYFRHRHPLDQIYYMGTENVLGLGVDAMAASSVEAVYADYELPKGPQGVLALRYVKPEEAAKALAAYTASVKEEMTSVKAEAPWTTLTARNAKTTLAFQKDRILILAFESSQPAETKAVIEKIAKALAPRKDAAK